MASSAERMRRYRDRRRELGLPVHTDRERAQRRDRSLSRRFIGCDGEGAGVDDLGRQLYPLFRMGDRELFSESGHLTTAEILAFICDAPADAIHVGFAFGYDTTQILRDLSSSQRTRLFAPRTHGPGKSPYVWFGSYGIEYLPRNYLRVCRLTRVERVVDGVADTTMRVVPGTARTIWDVFAFFQSSFVKALTDWNIGTKRQREAIQREKDRRSDFGAIGERERAYCLAECDLLAELMEQFRKACWDADLKPRSWSGAGKLAEALHVREHTMTRADMLTIVPADVVEMSSNAYYGGRFEIMRTGAVAGPIYEADISSAYPHAMLSLPCLLHGRWRPTPGRVLDRLAGDPAALYVAPMRFDHPRAPDLPNLYGLPIRQKTGRVFWPRRGNGWYWSTEYRAARLLGCEAKHGAGWRYDRNCDCQPFAWVAGLYDYRKSIGKSGKGLAIKLAINALYGKLVQRIGSPRFGNPVWGSLITAITRARLIEAAALDPDSVLMIATDGIYTTRRLDLDYGPGLGQWELAEHKRIFIVQPGIYWGMTDLEGKERSKTRGVPRSIFAGHTDAFETAWRHYGEADRAALFPGYLPRPEVAMPMPLFIGLRLAQARGKSDLAGRWMRGDESQRKFRFDWSGKRGPGHWETDDCVWHRPPIGAVDLRTALHAVEPSIAEGLDLERLELEDQPDHLYLTDPRTLTAPGRRP